MPILDSKSVKNIAIGMKDDLMKLGTEVAADALKLVPKDSAATVTINAQ